MWPETLQPRLGFLQREEVLVQAWKKASAHIRYHNWFSDTLELDWTSVNLPQFLGGISSTLQSPEIWQSDPIRLILAPKTQPGWETTATSDWKPPRNVRLRPLAHVTLRDQVVATAIMQCLADRVETRQGDPRVDVARVEDRTKVVSYGNRLFCDTDEHDGNVLRHRWGSAKLYRKYFQDYRTFLARPESVARGLIEDAARDAGTYSNQRPFIVCTDLSKFYDRVHPALLHQALDTLSHGSEEAPFFAFAKSMLRWRWHPSDRQQVKQYAGSELTGFSEEVSLPQGLVAAGFFANVVLLSLDERVIDNVGEEIASGICLHDMCRYVDDIRLVVSVADEIETETVGKQVCEWLQEMIDEEAPGLQLEKTKTKTIGFGESAPQLVRIGVTMDRVQTAVSGGFDAVEGERILDTVQSLIRSQPAAFTEDDDSKWYLTPVPDVRDDTLARFCAGRFRMTYRSLRPLLDSADGRGNGERVSIRSQRQLDDQARSFALTLIDRWVRDPSNIRVLRIGLDVWPHSDALNAVLKLLGALVWSNRIATGAVRVAWYCLSELFRAGATETGMVESAESLHGGIDIEEYRTALRAEAERVMLSGAKLPWYLRQQAFLFLVATGHVEDTHGALDDLPSHYTALASFLLGDSSSGGYDDLATAAILVRRTLRDRDEAVAIVLEKLHGRGPQVVGNWLSTIGVRDLSFLDEILGARSDLENEVEDWLRLQLGRGPQDVVGSFAASPTERSVASWVQADALTGPLRNELTLLRFATKFLEEWRIIGGNIKVITPNQVRVELTSRLGQGIQDVNTVTIAESTVANDKSLYGIPGWCPTGESWRLQLGYLLRFILSGRPDYTRPILAPTWREDRAVYRPPESHWYLRRYGFFNAQQAFGDDWLPISDWMEDLLMALLRWPGCRPSRLASDVRGGINSTLQVIEARISWLQKLQGIRTDLLVLPVSFRRKSRRSSIHACVAQIVIPERQDFESHPCDPTLGRPSIRGRHRSHLATTLMAVRTMVEARASHLGGEPRLDWLILPELAVHPFDVRTQLIPFARVYKTLILTGLTYQRLRPEGLLVNSALWIMPEYSSQHGLQIRILRQGKQHLTPSEKKLSVKEFRPCQWLIEYPCTHSCRPEFRLTSSICYDATDLRLASDLRDKSDVFAIPALNKDVKTFDRMALALHYHMFQLVVLANSGRYGGSSAYWPVSDRHKRRIFHLHGQPQMSIAFLEIGGELLDRYSSGDDWKHPPAGLEFLAGGDGSR